VNTAMNFQPAEGLSSVWTLYDSLSKATQGGVRLCLTTSMLICRVLNDADSSSSSVAWSSTIITGQRIGNDTEGRGRGLI
jgi:hypothetical protein